MTDVRLSPDRSTITVFVPVTWRRRGGRKVITAPPGRDDWAPPPKIDGALVKALARAHRWRRLLEEGRFGTLADLADAERISRSYVCRVLRLSLLAPDIVERILDGRPTAGLALFLKPFPVEWEMQRRALQPGATSMVARDAHGPLSRVGTAAWQRYAVIC
jgi:hypothetical protein